jgi:DNA-binding protein H-NS
MGKRIGRRHFFELRHYQMTQKGNGMATLVELLKQKEDLDKQIAAAQTAERAGAIKEIVAICGRYGIKYADLKPHMTKQRAKRGSKAAASSSAV